jgi:hypothetical protein
MTVASQEPRADARHTAAVFRAAAAGAKLCALAAGVAHAALGAACLIAVLGASVLATAFGIVLALGAIAGATVRLLLDLGGKRGADDLAP